MNFEDACAVACSVREMLNSLNAAKGESDEVRGGMNLLTLQHFIKAATVFDLYLTRKSDMRDSEVDTLGALSVIAGNSWLLLLSDHATVIVWNHPRSGWGGLTLKSKDELKQRRWKKLMDGSKPTEFPDA